MAATAAAASRLPMDEARPRAVVPVGSSLLEPSGSRTVITPAIVVCLGGRAAEGTSPAVSRRSQGNAQECRPLRHTRPAGGHLIQDGQGSRGVEVIVETATDLLHSPATGAGGPPPLQSVGPGH